MKASLLTTLALVSASSLFAAKANNNKCAPEPAAPCNADECCRTYCLGPENVAGLASVRPYTCNGDIELTIAGFYWVAHEDGLEYAIDSEVAPTLPGTAFQEEIQNIIGAEFESPHFKWDFGFKVGLGYASACDGWDLGVTWTRFRGKANSHIEADENDNHTLLPIWSNFAPVIAFGPPFATDIEARWSVDIDLIDIELGREFWTSRKLALRPHMGIRVAYLKQDYDLEHKGGNYYFPDTLEPLNNQVEMSNDFHGVGVRGGLDSNWHFGCGWSVYGNLAFSLLYGRFNIDHEEHNREVQSPFGKQKALEVKNSFRASRYAADFGLGLEWQSFFCNCDYALTVQFGWEQHIFFDQNQLWRIDKTESLASGGPNLEENVYAPARGDLDTAGWTLKVAFDF